jgi:hypothetical protein
MKRIVLAATVAAFVLVLVPVALAGKGGPTASTATIVSSCNPCAVGTYVHFTGSGYDKTQPRGMVALTGSDGSTTWAGINFDSDGTTSFDWYMSPAGTYDVKVLQNSHKKLVLKAELKGLVVQ